MKVDMLLLTSWAFNIYYAMIFVYILMSWLPHVRDSPLGIVLAKVVEPYLAIFRRFIPPIGMIDISPLIAILALHFVEEGVMVVVRLVQVGLS